MLVGCQNRIAVAGYGQHRAVKVTVNFIPEKGRQFARIVSHGNYTTVKFLMAAGFYIIATRLPA
jgi:TRAP-type C4-dicarboxylate transport system permease small subunit